MRSMVHFAVFAAAVVVAAVFAGAASAAPASSTFAIVGYEYAFTQTVGAFAGTGTGDAGDSAAWNTHVEHDPLGSTPTYVDGGRFELAARSTNGAVDAVTGAIVYHGGTITTLDPGAGCTNQRYLVTATLSDVTTATTTGGSGDVQVVLTHYRTSLFGRCLIYKARVAGRVSFAY